MTPNIIMHPTRFRILVVGDHLLRAGDDERWAAPHTIGENQDIDNLNYSFKEGCSTASRMPQACIMKNLKTSLIYLT